MKSTLAIIAGITAFAIGTSAALLVDEPFAYSDGSLVTVSGGVWANHSGSVGQVDVAEGAVNLSQSESEDVNRQIPGDPYATNGYLYASFQVNFSQLPAGNGNYFAHFKDDGTFNFRARIFATTTGAASGNFRLGLANASGLPSAIIDFDLALSALYTVVVRWDTTNAVGSLWINPASEDSTFNRADATDSTSNAGLTSFALRQSTSSGNGMGRLTLDNLKIGTAFTDVFTPGNPATNPPVVSAIADQSIPMNSSTPEVPFTVNDSETPAANLQVTAFSSNTALVPHANIALGGSGADRSVMVTPVPGQQGTAVIVVTVTDGDDNSTDRTFTVVVGAPSISDVPNQITQVGTATDPIAFTVGDAETPAGNLNVSGYSSDPTLVPNANLAFGGSGADRTVTITPAPVHSGLVTITLVVSDGSSSVSNQFVLTIAPVLAPDLNETFTYADGLLPEVSGFVWDTYSPSPANNDARVVSNQLFLSQTNSDDVRAFIGLNEPDGYYDTNSGYVVYYSLKVRMLTLPDGNGTYFALLKDLGSFNFRARLFVTANGAAPGKYRIGIANSSAITSAYVEEDLQLGSDYVVTVRYNVSTGESKVWVNPTSESSNGVAADDNRVPVDIWNFAFRQNGGIGELLVDDLKVGTRFADVYTEPNWPPTISDIADQITPFNTTTPAIAFTVSDLETAADALVLTASSTNIDLVPAGNIVFGGSGSDRTVTITPVAGQSGTAEIAVQVQDAGGNVTSESFLVTVLAPNNAPFVSDIPDQSVLVNTATPAVPFTIYDLETPAESLTLNGSSSNPALVPDANIVFGGSGSNRTVTVTPVPGQTGTATITLQVGDGTFVTDETFDVHVNVAVSLADRFSYPDGSVITNSGFLWNAHSGQTGQMQVVSGELLLSGGQSEDINAGLTNSPFPPSGAATLYAGLTVNFSGLPGTGAYFAHFKDGATGFRGRLFATTSGAAPDRFRLGIANGSGSPNVVFDQDLELNKDYRVMVRYDVGTAESTLWVDPAAETDASVTAADSASTITVTSFAFRQSSGIGDLAVDDLIVGTTFEAALGGAPRPRVAISRTGPNSLTIAWPASLTGFELQSSTSVTGGWDRHPDQGNVEGDLRVVQITGATGTVFFRLASVTP